MNPQELVNNFDDQKKDTLAKYQEFLTPTPDMSRFTINADFNVTELSWDRVTEMCVEKVDSLITGKQIPIDTEELVFENALLFFVLMSIMKRCYNKTSVCFQDLDRLVKDIGRNYKVKKYENEGYIIGIIHADGKYTYMPTAKFAEVKDPKFIHKMAMDLSV